MKNGPKAVIGLENRQRGVKVWTFLIRFIFPVLSAGFTGGYGILKFWIFPHFSAFCSILPHFAVWNNYFFSCLYFSPMVFGVIDYKTRKVEIAGIIPQAHGDWMKQMARNLTDPIDGFLKDKKYLVHDWDSLFTKDFKEILRAGGVKCVKASVACPNMNPFVERFVRSIKYECLNKILIFGERHFRYVISEYMTFYHEERPHQGIGNNIIEPQPQPKDGEIVCHERLGGLLKSYRRAA